MKTISKKITSKKVNKAVKSNYPVVSISYVAKSKTVASICGCACGCSDD